MAAIGPGRSGAGLKQPGAISTTLIVCNYWRAQRNDFKGRVKLDRVLLLGVKAVKMGFNDPRQP